jgi:hypothetical protein
MSKLKKPGAFRRPTPRTTPRRFVRREPTGGVLDFIARCADDESPMIQIGDRYVCALEYTSAHLGKKRVVRAEIRPDRVAVFHFADGHSIPLLCPCCAGILCIAVDDAEFNRLAVGLHVVGVMIAPYETENGEMFSDTVWLALSRNPDAHPNDPKELDEEFPVHLQSVLQLYCPKNETQK